MIGFPFDSHVTFESDGTPVYDRAITSAPLRKLIAKLLTDGILPNPSTNLQVEAGSGMNVVVNPGFAICAGGLKLEENQRTLAIQAADSNYDRIDTVVLRWNDNDSERICDLYIVEGIPAASPLRPELTRTESIWELGLADLFVNKNSSAISNQRITDTRYETARCGIISAISEFDTTTLYQQVQADLAGFKASEQADFITWFNDIKGQLSEDAALNLQKQIGTLESLKTEVKTNLVNALNWVVDKMSGVIAKLGSADISKIGDGTVTGAIVNNKEAIEDVSQSLTIINENLIPYPYHETTRMINGVTFIDNGDGTITANGTATDDLIFWIKYFNDLEIDDNIKYTISGSPNGSSSGKYCLSARVYTKKDAPSPSSGKIIRVSQAGTVVTGYKYIAPYISVWKGVTLNNVIFKPMLEYGTVASDYKQYSMSNAGLQEQIEMCKENLIPFPYCATSTGSYAKSFNSSSLTTVEAKNDGSLLIGSNGKIPSKTNQVLFRLIHDNFENIPLYNDIYSMDPHFENRPSASGVALAVSFERAKDSELETFYVTSPVEINNIDGKYTKIKYISVWLSTATASFENVKMKPTITRGGITEKRDVVSQKLSMDAIVARTRNSLNIVHLPLKETKTLTLAQLYNSYAKQNDVLYVTVIDYSDSKSYKSSTMLLFIDDFQIYAISTEGLLKYDNVNDKWAVIIPRA